jgi:iron uptake system EfeUOB component EfeO/EfeM
MENCTNVLSTSNSINKNKISNTAKTLNGKSFDSIFNKIIANKINDSLNPSLTTASNSSTEEINKKMNEKLEEELEQKADADVERLASFFGIGKHLMAVILKGLNIDPKELLDPSRKKDIVETLTKKFGLDKNRAEALASLVTDFQK